MKYPSLVPESKCKTDIRVVVYSEDINEDGEQVVVLDLNTKCNYQDKARQVLTAQKQLIQLAGQVLFNGDIAPELATISGGYVEVFGEKRNIYQGEKARNLDGTVNYTRIDLQ